MNISSKIKEFFSKIFNKQRFLDVPKEENNIIDDKIKNKKNAFEESIAVDLKAINSQNNKGTVIETLMCEGDGTGFQTIKI